MQAIIFEAYKKQIRMTFIAPQRTKGNKVQIFQSTAHSMKGAKQLANIQAGRPLVSGQLRVALFSQSLAKQGLSASIDVLTREASIGHALQITIIEGDVKKFVTYPYQTTENVSLYLYRLLLTRSFWCCRIRTSNTSSFILFVTREIRLVYTYIFLEYLFFYMFYSTFFILCKSFFYYSEERGQIPVIRYTHVLRLCANT
ncbi:hypothetical protein CBR56_29065 [Bacillus thuringiensis]|nr:hypothetical protein BK728_24180 [Bacillus thuringiensis serovar chanpaisis]PNK22541.1 hypothetical protein CBR56_29065 [Bacillus thuringiensis]